MKVINDNDMVMLRNGETMRYWAYKWSRINKKEYKDKDHEIVEWFESRGVPGE